MALRVLVFDKTRETEQLARDLLVPRECQLITASSVALAVFLARKNFPSLILCDLRKGSDEDDPLDLVREIKADDDLNRIPLIVIAGEAAFDAEVQKLAPHGMLRYPISQAQWLQAVLPFLHELQDEREPETAE